MFVLTAFTRAPRPPRLLHRPVVISDTYKGADKLKDKVAIVTGGDSGIGRSVAVSLSRQ